MLITLNKTSLIVGYYLLKKIRPKTNSFSLQTSTLSPSRVLLAQKGETGLKGRKTLIYKLPRVSKRMGCLKKINLDRHRTFKI
jgi:hypothetical protein